MKTTNISRRVFLAGTAAAAVGCATNGSTQSPGVLLQKESGVDVLNVYIDGVHFTSYHYSNENKKPFLWPVYGEDQVAVTRAWPMGEREEKADHPHHKSLWTSYGHLDKADVTKVDCWGEGRDSGRQVSGVPEYASGDASGWIKVANTWQSNDGKPVIAEAREYRFHASPPGARLFDVRVTFTAAYGEVIFKDTKEGGIVSLRIRDCIRGERGGSITNALGGKGERECWGKPSPWCDYSGTFEDGKVRGIAVFDHPGNLRHPTRWHVRDYGLMGANCFGLSYFTERDPERLNGDYTVKNGESLTFNYRVLVHTGDAQAAKVAEHFAEYAAQSPAT